MAVKAYILVETKVSRAEAASKNILALKVNGARVKIAEIVTGRCDIIVQIEADSLDALYKVVTDGIQRVEGVEKTTTCIAVKVN